MGHENFQASDHKAWEEAGLDLAQGLGEMTYVNQEDDGFETLKGEWFIADDLARTIIYGTFGNFISPGASHYTYADVYDDETEYRAEVARWEALPEYLERDDDDEDYDSCEDEEYDQDVDSEITCPKCGQEAEECPQSAVDDPETTVAMGATGDWYCSSCKYAFDND